MLSCEYRICRNINSACVPSRAAVILRFMTSSAAANPPSRHIGVSKIARFSSGAPALLFLTAGSSTSPSRCALLSPSAAVAPSAAGADQLARGNVAMAVAKADRLASSSLGARPMAGTCPGKHGNVTTATKPPPHSSSCLASNLKSSASIGRPKSPAQRARNVSSNCNRAPRAVSSAFAAPSFLTPGGGGGGGGGVASQRSAGVW
mmetsp:Transcript_93000/g.259981  ORF Transcript_93000/g.259981 Transcript_93000/m.259981 type:complete len:205 (+) Transcript_93000:397-1011(+)